MKEIIKDLTPPALLRFATGFFYGWNGNFNTWDDAVAASSGYNAAEILQKVKSSVLKIKNNEAAYERDSVLFDKNEFAFPVVATLLKVATENNNELDIIDFGGSLGSSYFQNIKFLSSIKKINWNVVEQKHFVECGKSFFQNENLNFYYSIDECMKEFKPKILLLSSVLQYLANPYAFLESVFKNNFSYILIDRTSFVTSSDRITVQKVHPKIYKATYPCWFFNKQKMLDFMLKKYTLLAEFPSLDKANIKSEFKGFVFELNRK